MARTILTRYLDPDTLGRIAGCSLEPRGLVLGNLSGAHKSPLAGFAVEFAGHREYVPGDDTRHIDWRVYFSRDKYFIKQYQMETNLVCHLLLDVSASMRYGAGPQQKLLYSSQLACTLAHSIIRQSDKVAFATFDDQIRVALPPSNSSSQIVRIADVLDSSRPMETTELPVCVNEMAGRLGRREIVMIFSDFFTDLDALEPALQQLRFQQHEVVLFQVLHHDELHFDFKGPAKFVGLEIPQTLLARPEDLRQAYLQSLERFQNRLKEICQCNRCEHVVLDTNIPMAEELINYLNSRTKFGSRR